MNFYTDISIGIILLVTASSTGYREQRIRCVAHPYIVQPQRSAAWSSGCPLVYDKRPAIVRRVANSYVAAPAQYACSIYPQRT
ncbi:hypothetical protein DFJ58DRAFT_447314 [Suillus subalutaceus]|uniref:uncharacterized protein n=1 Tax=Suillus subalutaceus TaxID=48586 RepID=UPI001B8737DE|nr:uncharacterized protein DFJ58DRAFT_447314 [Suillus subalutaceus]KAG1849930.1 hypothetical protein DFJ58DRAFT_447314 [Suillus subalutaceus]